MTTPNGEVNVDANAEPSTEEKVVPFAQYQKLQRKLDRQAKALKDEIQSREELRAGVTRLEDMLLTAFGNSEDPDAQAAIDKVKQGFKERRTADMTTAEKIGELRQIIDGSDEEVDFSASEEAMRNGNVDLALTLARDATSTAQKQAPSEDEIERRVQERVNAWKQEAGRVDTGGATASAIVIRTPEDLRNLSPADRKEATKAILEKMREKNGR